jgi:hypothetical protein
MDPNNKSAIRKPCMRKYVLCLYEAFVYLTTLSQFMPYSVDCKVVWIRYLEIFRMNWPWSNIGTILACLEGLRKAMTTPH